MSQWTHFLGVIRYDSIASNIYPVPYNKDKIESIEMQVVSDCYQHALPHGSEGPLRVDFKTTNRGPTVFITGDLRDFGKENLDEIVFWVKKSNKKCLSIFKEISSITFIRDMFIYCDVEYDDNLYVICNNDDEIELIVYNRTKTYTIEDKTDPTEFSWDGKFWKKGGD